MTIKTKLIVNMLITTGIVIAISLAGFSSIGFLQQRLQFISEKSTPFQIATVEFQRELQSYITDLLKLSAARNMTEYKELRKEAEESLGNVLKSGQTIEKLQSSRLIDLTEELKQIANEICTSVEARIQSDVDVSAANESISEQMNKTSQQLKELELLIRKLQVTRSDLFADALQNNMQISARLRELEALHSLLKDLSVALVAAYNATTNTAFLVAKGKAKTILNRIARNTSSAGFPDLKVLSGHTVEFLELQESVIYKKNKESQKWALTALEEITEITNRLKLSLNQEIELISSRLQIETVRQGSIFNESLKANGILLANSELVNLGLLVTGDTKKLFFIESAAELDKLDLEIRSSFTKIDERVKTIEKTLSELNSMEEQKILRAAVLSLAEIKNRIYSQNGILFTLKKKLDAINQSKISAEKLDSIIVNQTAKAKESVLVAQKEQENSFESVNNMIRLILSQVGTISSIAIFIAIFFGFWIYRSVVLPLLVVLDAVRRQQKLGEEKASLAEAVAGGDLSREVTVSEGLKLDPKMIKEDEMGIVLKALVGMSEAQVTLDRAFAGMTASLRRNRDEEARRDRMKNGLHELDKILRLDRELEQTASLALAYMAEFVGARVGIIYQYDEKDHMLRTLSTYAISKSQRLDNGFRLGEGLVGQVALERKKICINELPEGYLPITSALGNAEPLNVAVLPIIHNHILAGVVELGSFRQFEKNDFDFLAQSLEAVAVTLYVRRSA